MAQQGGGGGQADNSYQPLWLIALLCFAGIVIWFAAGEQLKEAFLFLKRYQLIVLDYVLQPFAIEEIQANTEWVRYAHRDELTLENAKQLAELTGKYYSIPYTLLFIFFAARIFFKNPLMRYKKKYNMKTLAAQEQKIWPQIRAVSKVDLIAEDLDSGPWSMALTPMQFSRKYKLLKVDFVPAEALFAKTKAPEFIATLLKERAERVFAAQLGRMWRGPTGLPPHRRAIFAILIAKGCRDSKKAYDMVGQLSYSASMGKLNYEGVDELWKKHYPTREVQELCKMHAYELTVFISLLQYARQDGVLASADFLWVKPMDRRFWYVLNHTGRQTPGAEVGGIFNHWYHECALKRALSMPVVDGAVKALEIALTDVIYQPDDKEKDEVMARFNQPTEAAST